MTESDFARVALYVIGSVGGAGAITIGIGKWFGGLMASHLLQAERATHERELEKLKGDLEATNRRLQSMLDRTAHAYQARLQIEFHAILDLWKKVSEAETAMQILRPEASIGTVTGDRDEDSRLRDEGFNAQFAVFMGAHNALLEAYRAQSVFVTREHSALVDSILKVTSREVTQIQLAGNGRYAGKWYDQGEANYRQFTKHREALSEVVRTRLDELILIEGHNS